MWSSCMSRASCKIWDLQNYFFYKFFNNKIAINWFKFTPKSWHFYVNFLVLQSFLLNFRALVWHVSPPLLPQFVARLSVRSPKKVLFFIGGSISIGRNIWCLLYLGFFLLHRFFCSLKSPCGCKKNVTKSEEKKNSPIP